MKKLIKTLFLWLLLVAMSTTFSACSMLKDPLDGTHWQMVGWTLSSLYPGDFAITAEFDNGQISGNSGVNSYGGAYTLGVNNTLQFEQLMTTLMAGPETAMRAEQVYMQLLGEVKTYNIVEDELILYDSGGNELLIFRKTR